MFVNNVHYFYVCYICNVCQIRASCLTYDFPHLIIFFRGEGGGGGTLICVLFFKFLTYPFPSFFWFGLSIFKLGLGQTLIHLILVRSLRQLLVCFSLLLSTGRLQSGIKFECGFHQFQTNCSHTLNLS